MRALPFPRTAPPDEVLREASAALSSGRAVSVATVIARQGSAPSTPGQKLAVFASEGELIAQIARDVEAVRAVARPG